MKITQMLADKEDITPEQQSALWRGPHAPPPAGGREEYPQPFYAGTERSAKELASFLETTGHRERLALVEALTKGRMETRPGARSHRKSSRRGWL